jgi:thiol-disulfide isomerase/thioredoxin
MRWKNGRFAQAGAAPQAAADQVAWPGALGERATLVQFSSAFCAPCRTTRVLLDDVSGVVPGVEVIHVDAEEHLDLVRQFDVMRTPTVLVLDANGALVTRASGVPRREQVLAALAQAMG